MICLFGVRRSIVIFLKLHRLSSIYIMIVVSYIREDVFRSMFIRLQNVEWNNNKIRDTIKIISSVAGYSR